MQALGLHSPAEDLPTYPSWRPQRGIDHILVGPTLRVTQVGTLPCHYSDHLPVVMEVQVPAEIQFEAHPTATVAV